MNSFSWATISRIMWFMIITTIDPLVHDPWSVGTKRPGADFSWSNALANIMFSNCRMIPTVRCPSYRIKRCSGKKLTAWKWQWICTSDEKENTSRRDAQYVVQLQISSSVLIRKNYNGRLPLCFAVLVLGVTGYLVYRSSDFNHEKIMHLLY